MAETPSIHNTDTPRLNGHSHNLPSEVIATPTTAPQQKPILLVDSDTTARVAAQYLPPHWDIAAYDPASKTNLGSITHAVIWGRNDEGGRAWAESVADDLQVPSHVVNLVNVPPHWHLGAELPPGRTQAQLTAYLRSAISRCQQRRRAAAARPTAPQPPPDVVALDYIRSGSRGDGAVKPIMQNAALLLGANPQRWPLRYNAFSQRTCVGNEYLTDPHILSIVSWVQSCGVHASTAVITDAIHHTAMTRQFHPVREYLEPLRWDGIPRLDMLFVDHAGTPDTPLARAVTSRWFIQAIARIMEPGSQADATIVLEGDQGLHKSTLCRELFGDMWFTDHLPDLTSKDALIQLRGVWCVEIGELATLGRAEIAKINQFLTSRVDRYRDPYGRVVADFPRSCVFAGSINPGASGYLKDATGGRRFWPIEVNERINIPAIRDARDQMWAEARTRYEQGERWYLDTDDLRGAAQQAVNDRYASDPWQDRVDEYLSHRTETTLDDLFRIGLRMDDIGKWSGADMARIGRCLAFAGWIRVRDEGGPAVGLSAGEGAAAVDLMMSRNA